MTRYYLPNILQNTVFTTLLYTKKQILIHKYAVYYYRYECSFIYARTFPCTNINLYCTFNVFRVLLLLLSSRRS